MARRDNSKPIHGFNGIAGDLRYRDQQSWIEEVAAGLGLSVYIPDYHGKSGDGNTVLVYLPEDAEHNTKVDAEPLHYASRNMAKLYGCTDERYFYRDPIWAFENTDQNGFLSFDYANHGKLDLRFSKNWKDVIAGSIELAYYKSQQNRYAIECGGFCGIHEADDTYNDLNIRVIESFRRAYGKAILGSINPFHEGDPIFWEYDGKNTFFSQFVVAVEDQMLRDYIRAWRGDDTLPKSWANVDKITSRVTDIGGELLIWY